MSTCMYADTFGNGDIFSVLLLRPHVNGFFWQPKTEVFENALHSGGFRKHRFRVYVWTGENGGFRKRWRDR